MKKSAILFSLLFFSLGVFGQGTFSGDLMTNVNFFMKDTNIKASGNPLYENKLSGSEAWFTLRYANNNGLTAYVRGDAFDNSNLKVTSRGYSDFGIGAWNITKEYNDLTISVGSIYDQIGSGILFRSYEDRGLMIDNALVGLELKYKFSDKIYFKAFSGQQKNNSLPDDMVNNHRYGSVIRGLNGEGDFNFGKVHINPGFGVLNRTLDDASMQSIAGSINGQDLSTRFLPKYNMYAFSVYNTLTYKNFSWYAEGAYKTHEAIYNTNSIDATGNIDPLYKDYVDRAGNIVYTSVNYGKKGIALSLTGKRTQDFVMRVSPPAAETQPLEGMLNWQPVVAVLRPQRLMSRYSPPSQDISEMAGTANLLLSPNDVTNFTVTYSHINTLTDYKLFREIYAEGQYQGWKSVIIEGGVQYLEYNIAIYQGGHASAPVVYAVTPFAELTYKITDKKSLRFEAQYMNSAQDYGSWAYALLEYNIAPMFSISVSDMYNVVPNKNEDNTNYKDPGNHYYSVYTAYTKGPHRFSLAYVKQVDGMNCSGGVCRYEPAFSGVKATLNTSF